MTRVVERKSSPLTPALWLAAGAAAGVALGLLLADRAGGSRRVIRRLKRAVTRVSRLVDGWSSEAEADAELGEEDDADDADQADETDGADTTRTDEADSVRIDQRVLAAFENDPVLAERAIEIDEPEPGLIVLSGRVGSARDAAHAVTIARGTPGVESVENLLRVRGRARR